MTQRDTPPADAAQGDDEASRERGANGKRDRKERVLHTRIPAVLESELKAAADALRVPVSNLVRTILEDAVAIADRATGHVESGLERAAESVHSERLKLRERLRPRDSLDHVIAYQPVVVAQSATCARCAVTLAEGDDGALCVSDRPGPKLFVCRSCVFAHSPRA